MKQNNNALDFFISLSITLHILDLGPKLLTIASDYIMLMQGGLL